MKIELKSLDFKYLVGFLENNQKTENVDYKIGEILRESLLPQYEKTFLKYKDEKQNGRNTRKIFI